MNLYQIDNPNPNPPPIVTKREPACLTNPFCANAACDTSKTQSDRIAALLSQMTVEEKAQNMVDAANGVQRLGLPSYEWWQEVRIPVWRKLGSVADASHQALHGVASSPGVTFNSPNGSNFSYATSFPSPILMGSAFDDPLIYSVASTVGKEARAFANYAQSGSVTLRRGDNVGDVNVNIASTSGLPTSTHSSIPDGEEGLKYLQKIPSMPRAMSPTSSPDCRVRKCSTGRSQLTRHLLIKL